jgi:hypothetical protein
MKHLPRPGLPSPATVIALIALVVAAGGAAVAAIPSPSGNIHACYGQRDGTLRVVQHDRFCPAGTRRLVWNQKGVPGSPGIAGYQVRRVQSKRFSGDYGEKQLKCGGGRDVLGGGASIHGSPNSDFALRVSYPVKRRPGKSSAKWFAVGHRHRGENRWFMRLTVVCANVN